MMPFYTVTVMVHGSGPIAGASVYFDGAYVGPTDSDGGITIADVTAGSHTIEARKSGYESDSATISVPETTSVTLTLTPIAPPTYTVTVSVQGSGPIAGAMIHLDGFAVDYTDAAGMLTIPNVTAGTHTIGAIKYGYEPASTTISVPETTSVTLMLTPIVVVVGAAVTIVVREKVHDVPPIEGVNVELAGLTEYTDAGGYAFFPEVPVTWKTLKASKFGFKTWTGTIRISAPETRAYIYLERT